MDKPAQTEHVAVDTEAQTRKKLSDPITLAEPIVRGETTITEIVLRKPKAGELRGLSMQELMRSEVSAIIRLVPRIAMPSVIEAEVENFEAEDLAACGGAILDFFLTEGDRKAMEKMLQG